MSLTNLIALFHIIILPIILYLLYQETFISVLMAIFLLFISIFLDFIEKLTRKSKKIQSFIHPFSDKIVVLLLLFFFAFQGSFSKTILIIFILRDLVIGILKMMASRDDVNIKGSSIYGKTLTAFQLVLVFSILAKALLSLIIFNLTMLANVFIFIFTAISLVLAIMSIFHSGYGYARGLRSRRKLGREVKKETMVILANRKSGGYRYRYRRRLLRVFAKRRKAKLFYLSKKRDMFAGVDKLVKGVKQVIIAGGDGSFEGALNYNPLKKKSLGFFPLGAGNSFYSYFYKGKRFEYLRSRFKFQEVPFDILELQWNNQKVETLFLGVGVDAEVVKELKDKKHHKFSEYFRAGAKVAFKTKINYDFNCQVDDKMYHWKNGINIIIGKVPYIGFGIRSLLGSIKDDDGLILGMACVNTHSPIFNKALRLWSILLTQMDFDKSPLVSLKGKVFIVKSDKPFPLQAGGDFLGYTKEIKVRVKRKQKILVI